MTYRLLSIWFAVLAASTVAFFCKLVSFWMKNLVDQTLAGKPLPSISALIYAPDSLIYWFPIPLALWAAVYTFRFGE